MFQQSFLSPRRFLPLAPHLLRRFASLLFVLLLLHGLRAEASTTRAENEALQYAAQEMSTHPVGGNLPDYALSPTKLQQAQRLDTVRNRLHFGGLIWNLLQFALLLWLGIVAWIRDRALAAGASLRERGKTTRAFWRECVVFTVLYTLVGEALDLPLALYRHTLQKSYGLSVQSWASWWGDWGKGLAIGLATSVLIFALLVAVIRKFPQRWWLVFWAALAPIIVFAVYISPLVIEPLFNKFEPLAKSQPELVARLEKVVEKGHMNIPPERMFLMKASAKVTTINAYVTGFGGSKRVVVWDTSLTKGTPDQVLFIFGHESGHYVLGHVMRGMVLIFAGLLVLLWLGYHTMARALRRFGPRWRITSQGDWGALAVLFFALAVFQTVLEPVTNGLSRTQEHAADVYGQEAIHGLVADPQETARTAFDVLGESVLEVPNPNPLIEFWTENHPSTGRRAAFSKAYDPWRPGYAPKYFPAQ